MLQYIIEVIIWTIILYGVIIVIRSLIYNFIVSPDIIKKIYNRTKSENKRAKYNLKK